MTPEERQKLKEKELAHLRELQRLKRLARQAKRQGRINRALSQVTDALESVSGQTDDVLAQLELENARAEARMDLALESQSDAISREPRATEPSSEPAQTTQPESEPPAKTIGTHLRRPTEES